MAVKQIQLRGISRTPSDRMTRDGGLAESLNMQLDGEELAPMRLPDDVTSELLGEGVTLYGRILFIHHVGTQFNYIEQDGTSIYSWINGVRSLMANLGGNVRDIVSNGVILIVLYDVSPYISYFIYKDGAYYSGGSSIPDPSLEFIVTSNASAETSRDIALLDMDTSTPIYQFDETVWNKVLSTPEVDLTEQELEYKALALEVIQIGWDNMSLMIEANRQRGIFSRPILARYAVRLYDGSYVNVSQPVMLGAYWKNSYRMAGLERSSSLRNAIRIYAQNAFSCSVRYWHYAPLFGEWKDLIASVDVFLSEYVEHPQFDARATRIGESAVGFHEFTFEGQEVDKEDKNIIDGILDASNFYLAARFSVDELELMMQDSQSYDLLTETKIGKQEYLVTQPRLREDFAFGYIPHGMMNYNSRLVAKGADYALPLGYRFLPGPTTSVINNQEFKLRYFIRDKGVVYTIDGQDPTGVEWQSSHSFGNLMGMIFYPDTRCFKVEIENYTTHDVFQVEMKEHPNLNCSYGYLFLYNGMSAPSPLSSISDASETSLIPNGNKLLMTRTDNPFVYELGNTQTFDDDIIDAATIAKALITNPYGLADIYVFTKGGIYSIGLMRDGSFNNIHPYTRDVLIPGTLTMIDHAVVFTTEKGVMLLSESGLQDISQVMRGKHDPLPAAAASLLNGDEQYRSLVPAATATEPFMAFMKGARAAYDYAGKRLLFFNNAYLYQYVFMLETATWHKTDMVGADSYTILNSHPQCLVAATAQAKTLLLLTSISDYPADVDTVARIIAAAAPSSAGLEWRDISADIIEMGLPWTCDVTGWPQESLDTIDNDIDQAGLGSIDYENVNGYSAVMDLSTLLDDGDYIAETGHEVKGLVVTRPLAFDAPDIRKVLKDLRIRTQANRTDVKYILLASMDGKTWKRLTSRGGGSFKWFKIVLVTSLSPIERIGWLDVDVQTRYMDKLR